MWPGTSPAAAGTPRTAATTVSRCRVLASVFPEQSTNSRFLGPAHVEPDCRAWAGSEFFFNVSFYTGVEPINHVEIVPGGQRRGSPGTTHASSENRVLFALQMLFPLPACSSFRFLYLLDLQSLLPCLLHHALFQAPRCHLFLTPPFILCPPGCLPW